MAGIRFFQKNIIDLDNPNITLTITDAVATNTGQTFVDFIRNRNNTSAWVTTGSTDAANTELLVDMSDAETFDRLILVGHNFKAFTIQYWNGSSFVDFSTPINETTNTDSTTTFTFNSVTAIQIKIIITACQTVDDDKVLKQLIVTEDLAQFVAYPSIVNPTHVSNRRANKMLSGKINMVESIGRFSVSLELPYWSSDADLTAVETIYFNRRPVLLWLCGGNETQFKTIRRGYRLEDIYLVRPGNDFVPNWYESIYTTGIDLKIRLDEVVD